MGKKDWFVLQLSIACGREESCDEGCKNLNSDKQCVSILFFSSLPGKWEWETQVLN